MSGHTVIKVEVLNFPDQIWNNQGETLFDLKVSPIPGSWCLAPYPLMQKGIKGMMACPNCNTAALIRYDMGQLINGVLELRDFQCSSCKFACHPRLLHWDKRKLFCVAYERLDEKTGMPLADKNGDFVRKEYRHHTDRAEAFEHFVKGYQTLGRFRVIDVGEVIGFFGLESDKDQINLTV